MFLIGPKPSKPCEKCGTLTQKTCGVCPNGSDLGLCSITCFNKHWDFHKDNFAILETFMLRFGDVLLDAQVMELIDFRFLGTLEEKDSNKKFIFLHDTDNDLVGNIKDHFEKQNLAGYEFANYFTTGKCGLTAYGFAGGLYMINRKYNILYRGQKVTEIGILDIEVTKEHITNILVFDWPGKCLKKGNHNIPNKSTNWQFWDVDNIHTNKHQVPYVKLENGETYTIDFAAAQYGIQSVFLDKFVHIENVTNGKTSLGNIFEMRIMDHK